MSFFIFRIDWKEWIKQDYKCQPCHHSRQYLHPSFSSITKIRISSGEHGCNILAMMVLLSFLFIGVLLFNESIKLGHVIISAQPLCWWAKNLQKGSWWRREERNYISAKISVHQLVTTFSDNSEWTWGEFTLTILYLWNRLQTLDSIIKSTGFKYLKTSNKRSFETELKSKTLFLNSSVIWSFS